MISLITRIASEPQQIGPYKPSNDLVYSFAGVDVLLAKRPLRRQLEHSIRGCVMCVCDQCNSVHEGVLLFTLRFKYRGDN